MPSRHVSFGLALWALLLTAGCGAPEITGVIASTQSRDLVEAALADGPMYVVIQGNPFAVPAPMLTDRVLTTMQRTVNWDASARFTDSPVLAATPSVFIVWTFNGAVVGVGQQCELITAGGGPRPAGQIAAMASLCAGGGTIAVVEGQLSRTMGLDDPQFTALVQQMTAQLLMNKPSMLPGAANY